MSKISITVIIVTHNAGRYIVPCLKSVLNSYDVKISNIVVIDNASSDNTLDLVKEHFDNDRRIKIMKLRRNVGYPLACNIGIVEARDEFVVLMNPDVVVDSYCFANLAHFMSIDSKIAVVQPKILHPGGYVDSAGSMIDILGHGFHIGKYERDSGQYNEPRDILYACFACVMVRRNIYLKLGGMDSRYFLYNEDLDFCWRCWLAGYRVVYVPSAIAYHVGQHATRRVPYHAIYFGRRNRLLTVLANYSLPLALLSAGLLYMLYVASMVGAYLSGDSYEARVMLRLLATLPRHIRYVARKRKYVNYLRRVSDLELLKRGLITPKLVGVRLYLSGLYRRQLKLR